MNKMLKELKNFAMKANALLLAIGLIVCGDVASILDSLRKDMMIPPFCVI